MRYLVYLFFPLFIGTTLAAGKLHRKPDLSLFNANNKKIQYTGRIDFSDPLKPRMWAPGAYIAVKIKGSKCELLINDEVLGGNNHNYLEIVVDDKTLYRIQATGKTNVIDVPGLSDGEHTILVCKDTESNTGYIEFIGLRCEKLLSPDPKPARKIEYFGDSITSGTGMDLSVVACGKGQWQDQHNAYMSYGARTSRNLNAQWQLTALAGVGLVHSCCDLNIVMPQIYDKLNLRRDSITWDFKKYTPDVVTICLGQNDGIQDSTRYCNTYVSFIQTIRQHYPKADIICLTSPMADARLTTALKHYLTSVIDKLNAQGDKKVSKYFFSKQFHNGCDGHPDMAEHELIANELTGYIKQLKGW